MTFESLDKVVTAFFPETQTRLTVANVTDTAKTLERNHLCGPTAGLIQAELVGGAVLMGTLLERLLHQTKRIYLLGLKLPLILKPHY